jgi:hypothetical protein
VGEGLDFAVTRLVKDCSATLKSKLYIAHVSA